MSNSRTILRLLDQYRLLRLVETTMLAISGFIVVFAILSISQTTTSSIIIISLIVSILLFTWRFIALKIGSLDQVQLSYYLNRQYPALMDSCDLLVQTDSQLSDLELIQQERLSSKIENLVSTVKFPHRLKETFALLVLSIVIYFSLRLITPLEVVHSNSLDGNPSENHDSTVPANVSKRSVEINSPSYTQLPKIKTEDLSFEGLQNSAVTWHLQFSSEVEHLALVLASGERIKGTTKGGEYILRTRLEKSTVYKLEWSHQGDTISSNYYKITVHEDQPPAIKINELPQFTRLKWDEKTTINLGTDLNDDYGIQLAHIIATVSKGSGESVKFREVKLSFSTPATISGKSIKASRTIDFNQLGMEPGDELYFYVEAIDNKQPEAQRSRTDTYFIALQDTASVSASLDEGLGVDLMPEYFRSQRQIIIDTEKLLAERKKLTKQQFKSTSNELGYDQKVLRLRYGQFLGEEFETHVGPGEGVEEIDASDEEEVVEEFGHQHDNENEHNLVPDQKSNQSESGNAHNHDNTDEATFFTQSIKAKLRAALTLMWDSELHLRLFEPAKSLPYQYQILKLLKEISQDSRIYVHRMGFDPPPIKEERRLTGDLAEISDKNSAELKVKEKTYPAIREAMALIELALTNYSFVINDSFKNSLEGAGNELARAAIDNPGLHLMRLSDIRSIVQEDVSREETMEKLKLLHITFQHLVPKGQASPTKHETTRHSLDVRLLNELKSND